MGFARTSRRSGDPSTAALRPWRLFDHGSTRPFSSARPNSALAYRRAMEPVFIRVAVHSTGRVRRSSRIPRESEGYWRFDGPPDRLAYASQPGRRSKIALLVPPE